MPDLQDLKTPIVEPFQVATQPLDLKTLGKRPPKPKGIKCNNRN